MAARLPKVKASAGGGGNRDRGPPPALFLHPSPQASHVSLPGRDVPGPTSSTPSITTTTTAPALSTTATTATAAGVGKTRDLTGITSPTNARDFTSAATGPGPGTNPRRTPGYPVSLRHNPSISSLASLPPLRAARSSDRTDALWAEMQATLEEVEFSATGSTHVFRAEHEKKLAELRATQIALAQAWARSEADEAMEMGLGAGAGSIDGQGGEVRNLKGTVLGSEGDGGADQARSVGSTARPGSSGMGMGGGVERLGRMEEETEVDILLAKKRREANDHYFQRVNQGVVDVVAKLADVAEAMRKVEQESKDIWGENESVAGNAKP